MDRLLRIIRYINRGLSRETRSALLTAAPDGDTPYDLLKRGLFDEVVRRLGFGNANPIPGFPPKDPAEQTLKPPPPWQLVGALHGAAHKSNGRWRPTRTARVKDNRVVEKR